MPLEFPLSVYSSAVNVCETTSLCCCPYMRARVSRHSASLVTHCDKQGSELCKAHHAMDKVMPPGSNLDLDISAISGISGAISIGTCCTSMPLCPSPIVPKVITLYSMLGRRILPTNNRKLSPQQCGGSLDRIHHNMARWRHSKHNWRNPPRGPPDYGTSQPLHSYPMRSQR